MSTINRIDFVSRAKTIGLSFQYSELKAIFYAIQTFYDD
jgi:hypothetical protein